MYTSTENPSCVHFCSTSEQIRAERDFAMPAESYLLYNLTDFMPISCRAQWHLYNKSFRDFAHCVTRPRQETVAHIFASTALVSFLLSAIVSVKLFHEIIKPCPLLYSTNTTCENRIPCEGLLQCEISHFHRTRSPCRGHKSFQLPARTVFSKTVDRTGIRRRSLATQTRSVTRSDLIAHRIYRYR